MTIETKRDLALAVLWKYYGAWYTWGADAAGEGGATDCSGLVQQPLKAVGAMPRGVDETAEMLRQRFVESIDDELAEPGGLVFWLDDSGKAVHVEMVVFVDPDDDRIYSMGASGGGASVKTIDDAIKANAFVKVRPVESRGGTRVYADPF